MAKYLVLFCGLALAACASASADVLHDNGPMITRTGVGPGGDAVSDLQTTLHLSYWGGGAQKTNNNRVADDFTVPADGKWQIDQITFYAYQNNSGTSSTLTFASFRIWKGIPGDSGSHLVFGDEYTNRLTSTKFMHIYRIDDINPPAGQNSRPIMTAVCTLANSVKLGPGTYWLDWQLDGTSPNGPWATIVTILGQTGKPGADGRVSSHGGTFNPFIDPGDNGSVKAPQDFAFLIEGVFTPVPCKPCDTSCDGTVNGFDIEPFIDILSGGAKCSPCAGDTNADGSVNGFDIQAFIDCLNIP